jgi:GntR family transcriptional regulator
MNATDVMLTEPATVHSGNAAGDNAPDARPVPSFDYARVAQTLTGDAAGHAGTPHLLTIAAQLAAILRARIRSGELAPGRPIPSESTLMQQYGVTRETVQRAVRALAAEGLVCAIEDDGACVAAATGVQHGHA